MPREPERPSLRAAVRDLRWLAEQLRALHPDPRASETAYLVGRLQDDVNRLADAMGRAWGE